MSHFVFAAAILSVCLSPMVHAQTQPAVIVFIGDSVTRGVRPGVTAEQTWCAVVEGQLRASGHDLKVINAGVGSDTMTGGLKRLENDVLAHHPTHVGIMFGLNDSFRRNPEDPPRVTLDQYRADLLAILAALRQLNITPIVMTSNPFTNARHNADLKPYVEICRAVAADAGLTLIDTYARFAELAIEGNKCAAYYMDDCHMNVEGNVGIANVVTPQIERILSKR